MIRFFLSLAVLTVAGCDLAATDDTEIADYAGPTLTEADAAVANPPFGPAGWDGYRFAGYTEHVVKLFRTTTCGDECTQTIELRFVGSPNDDRPREVEGRVVVRQYNPEGESETAVPIRRVEIQDWGPGVYSGVAFGAEGNPDVLPVRLVFWADDLPVAVE